MSATDGSRANTFLVLGAAAVAAVVIAFAARGEKRAEVPAREPVPSPASSESATVVYFDGGYAVGSANQLDAVIGARLKGTRTACEEPPPDMEARMNWSPSSGRLARMNMDQLVMQLSDDDLSIEVSSRLLDKKYSAGYATMSREEQNVFLVWQLQGEVDNGGVDRRPPRLPRAQRVHS